MNEGIARGRWGGKGMSLLRSVWRDRLQRDTLLLLGAQMFYKLTGVLIVMVLSRSLTATEIGVFFFATAFAESFLTLTGAYLGPLLMRQVATAPADAATQVSAVLVFRVASGLLFLLVVVGAAFLFASDVWRIVVVAALFTLCETLYFSFANLFIALKRTDYNVSIGVYVQIIFLVVFLLAIRQAPSLSTVLATNLLRNVALLSMGFLVTHFWLFPLRMTWKWSLLYEGLPFALLHVFTMLRSRSDAVLLGFLADYLQVGHYQLAYQFVFSSLFIPVVVTSVFFPQVAAEGLRRQNRRLFLLRAGMLFLCGCLAMGVAWGGAYPLTRALYGDIANDVAPVLQMMAPLFPLAFLYHFASGMLQALSREQQAVRIAAVTVTIGVLAGGGLIPLYGVYGAVAARLLSEFIGVALLTRALWPLLSEAQKVGERLKEKRDKWDGKRKKGKGYRKWRNGE
jgi:O-antigen/teichoic acid export membrane protein